MEGKEKMTLISYGDLAQLKLRDYVKDSSAIWVEESGMQINVGLGGFERCGETMLGWRQGEPYRVAEVTVDFGADSAAQRDLADRIICRLGLPVHSEMTVHEVLHLFGTPNIDSKSASGRFLRFICGGQQGFLVGFRFDKQGRLSSLFMARKDYCDEDEGL